MDDKPQTQKYDLCWKCEHWGSVFSYKRIAHEMMCGVGQNNCEEPIFGKQDPSGFIPRRLK